MGIIFLCVASATGFLSGRFLRMTGFPPFVGSIFLITVSILSTAFAVDELGRIFLPPLDMAGSMLMIVGIFAYPAFFLWIGAGRTKTA